MKPSSHGYDQKTYLMEWKDNKILISTSIRKFNNFFFIIMKY